MTKNYAIAHKELLGSNKAAQIITLLVIGAVLFRNLLIKFILLLLSYVVPKNDKILFFSSVGNYDFPIWKDEKDFQFKESPKYLALYSTKNLKDHTTVFHVPNKKLFGQIAALGIVPTKGIRAFWYMLRARCLFVDNNNFFNPNASFLLGRFQIVQTWHGTPLKNMGEDKKTAQSLFDKVKNAEKRKFCCILSACELASRVFKKLFCTDTILQIGYPRNDILIHPEYFACENVAEELALSGYEKVLLYAPTFRKIEKAVNPFDAGFLSRLNETLARKNYIFLIKQHPYSGRMPGLDRLSHIKDVSHRNGDIQELLVHVDVLVSDYSSVIFDFALTEKLQLFYFFDKDEYEKSRGDFYFACRQDNLPGLVIADKDDFIGKIEQLESLTADAETKTRISEFNIKYNQYTHGSSCEELFRYLQLLP